LLDSRAELTLYRAAQEGLTNVRKHARASRVDLTLNYVDPDRVSLSVRDNGLGAPVNAAAGGFGLLGLRERATQLGGQLVVESTNGRGFGLLVEIPTTEPALIDHTGAGNGDPRSAG
jgi:signal transduction histidine kinase